MNMQYNICLEVAAMIYTVLMYVFLNIQYPIKTELNLEFRKMVILCFLTTLMDVSSGIAIAYGNIIPPIINTALNTAYLLLTAVFGFQFVYYTLCFVYEAPESQLSARLNQGVCIVYGVLLGINLFTGWIFSFNSEGVYIHGPIYVLAFVIPFYYMLYAGIHFLRKNERCSMRQKCSLLLGVFFSISGCLVQAIFLPDILIGMFGVSAAMFVMLFSLETPNYQLLTETMEELERTRREAERAQIRAQDANKAKSRFLTNVSQEVKTPINAILNYDEKILGQCTEEEKNEYAVSIRSSGRVLLSMMNNILDFTSLDEGKIKLDKKPYSTVSFLQDICCFAEYEKDKKTLNLELNIDKWIPQELSGDSSRLLQVVGNLISNAFKFTEEGSVEISIMWEAVNHEEGELEFWIRDTGIGMREEEIQNISESFSKLDMQKNSKNHGLGLGLSIVILLLESMDSHLEIVSEYGKGSLFSFVVKQGIVSNVPIGKKDFYGNIQIEDLEEEIDFKASGLKVLMADDNVLNQDAFRELMKNAGMEIELAVNGNEALEKARMSNYDLILLDTLMPIMNGEEALAAMKKENLCQNIPVIALGGETPEEVLEKYMAMGFSGYAQKPFKPKVLAETLKSVLITRKNE